LWSKTPSGTIKYYTQNSDLSVYATTGSNQFSGSQTITGSLTVTGGITGSATTASYVEYAGVANKPALVSSSAQIVGYGIFATTGSNTFQANQTITGSLFITQNLVVAGSSSIQYISSSVLDIADNIITVNAFNPAIRFGGLAVIDSGSSPQVSGSLLFDSIKDQWIFVHQNQSVVTSSVVLMGPETYNDLGNESYISANRLPKGSGVEHLRDSNITDTGTIVSVNSNTVVTGTLSGSSATFSGDIRSNAIYRDYQGEALIVTSGSDTQIGSLGAGTPRTISLLAGNARRLFINTSGSVGINTNIPTEIFTVNVGVGARAGMALTGEYPYLRFNVTSSSANARNWAFNATNAEPGDFALLQSTATDGNPVTDGTSILGFGRSGAATFSSSVTIGASTALNWGPRGGISQDGSFNFNWSTNGIANAFHLQSATGNIGIGTTSPSEKLEVQNGYLSTYQDLNVNDAGYGIQFYTNGGGSKNSLAAITLSQVGTARSGNLLFQTSNAGAPSTKMIITSGGNILIGKTNDESYRLDVAGQIRSLSATPLVVAMSSNSANDAIVAARWTSGLGMDMRYNPDSAVGFIQNTYPVEVNQLYGDIQFRHSIGGTMTSRMIIKGHSGNVGIGTITPIEKFHVIGSGIFDNSSFGTAQIRLKGTGTSTGFDLQNSGNDGYLWNRDGGNIYFGTSNTERMRIQGTSVIIVGSLSKGSGSFKIDHPISSKKDTHHLVHSFIEGPQADNIYRGKIQLVNGKVTINLDQSARMTEGTFILLNGNIQCFTSNESGWTAVKGIVDGNILTIEAQDSECTDTISWLVIGERIDQHMLDTEWTDENGKVIVEPLKTE
jgi:hypothetical protein